MATTTISSRDFNQRVSEVKKASEKGPVFITDRGRPSHVLLTIEDYLKITDTGISLADALAMPGVEKFGDEFDIDLEEARQQSRIANIGREADLS